MKKYDCTKVLLISACLIILAGAPSAALDESGCLTCHQYPGLVRLEQTHKVRPLHIDEEKFVASKHGKIRCTQCHTSIAKVPHTGEDRINCTTASCHTGKDQTTLLKENPQQPFHLLEQSFIVELKDESSCRVCHTLYPHSENQLVRALLNMHTGFMFCNVCHIKRDKFKPLSYEWKHTENATFSGKPFGTFFDPQARRANETEHFISRITALTVANGRKEVLINTRDNQRAEAFNLEQKQLGPDEEKNRLAYFHREIEKKEISVACDECHSAQGILDFKQLGFDALKTDHLINMNIKGLVTKYKTFYFPQMFGN